MQFKLPELGEGVHEGELIKWKVKVGDEVGFDQPICEIMTDKATVEIPSPFKGKVSEIHAKEGEIVHVDQVMISFSGASNSAAKGAPASNSSTSPTVAVTGAMAPLSAAPSKSAPKAPAPQAPVQQAAAPQSTAPAQATAGDLGIATRVLASPYTRRAAREMGVDLATVQGSGEHGRVLHEDLSRGAGATSAGAPALARGVPHQNAAQVEERIPFRGLRKKIAEKMIQSKHKAAHFTYVEEADATNLVALRKQAKDIGESQGIKVTFLPFVMKAMVAALKKYPILNSSLDEDKNEIVIKHVYNIGLSIQTEDGLTAPVVKDVANKSFLQIAREIQDLVDRARKNKLTQEDFKGSTITLTNAGSIGGLFATPVINFPEVAIMGFNKIARKPVVVMEGGRETIAIRDWTYFSISLDHRIVDGAIGAEFMKLFIKYIENPALMLME